MRSDHELLMHIKDEMDYLLRNSLGISQEDFLKNATLTRAFARSLEIIGEATKNLSNELIVSNSDIEWRSMAGMRDKLIHVYFSVDYSIVWDAAVSKIPALLPKIESLLSRIK
jgi:uncharacterized protein with HEPN domain